MTVNPRLAWLLESGEFDWDNPAHRIAWLKAWKDRTLPDMPAREESVAEPAGHNA